jgi:hypothetical protein
MKTQAEINASWLRTAINTNKNSAATLPEITWLQPPDRNTGLRKPYQYQMAEANILRLKNAIKDALKPYANLVQCDLVDFKRTGLGFRVNIFVLAFIPQFCGDNRGVTESQWNALISAIKQSLIPLDPEAPVYAEPWNTKDKFQARFETYILRA